MLRGLDALFGLSLGNETLTTIAASLGSMSHFSFKVVMRWSRGLVNGVFPIRTLPGFGLDLPGSRLSNR